MAAVGMRSDQRTPSAQERNQERRLLQRDRHLPPRHNMKAQPEQAGSTLASDIAAMVAACIAIASGELRRAPADTELVDTDTAETVLDLSELPHIERPQVSFGNQALRIEVCTGRAATAASCIAGAELP